MAGPGGFPSVGVFGSDESTMRQTFDRSRSRGLGRRWRHRASPWVARVRTVGQRLAGPVGRVVDLFPLTPLGMAVLVLSGMVLSAVAFPTMDMVVLVAGYAGLAVVALAVLFVVPTAILLRLRPLQTGVDTLRLETERPTATGATFPWLAWMPLVSVEPRWESPSGFRVATTRAGFRVAERVTATGRGHASRVVRRVRVSDVLGLAAVAVRWTTDQTVEAFPHAGQLGRLRSLRSFAGGDERPHPMGLEDGDRVELRRYGPGDPARFIHWKVFGRTRRLMVRVPERALSRARRTIGYLIAGPFDEASAAAARVAVAQGTLGVDWVFGADGTSELCTEATAAIEAIVRSSEFRDAQGVALPRFVERAERRGPASLVLFAPAATGPWVERVLSLSRVRPQGLKVVIAVDRVVRRRPSPGWLAARWWTAVVRAVTRPSEDAGVVRGEELDRLLSVLRPARVEVLVLDRPTGRVLSGSEAQAAAIGNAA